MFLWDFLNNFRKIRLLHHQKRLAFFFVGFCIFTLAAPQIAPVSAKATQATVQEILDGNQVFIQNKRAAVKDVAKQSQQVRTGNSRTALIFNTGAVARLSANSVLKIGQCANLRRGTILINGAVNACSSSITTGVRGTTYLLEVDDSGNQQVKVLEGEVVVKRNAKPLIEEDLLEETTQPKPTVKPSPNLPTKPSTSLPNSTNNSSTNSPTTSPKTKQFSNFPTTSPNQPINLPQDNPQKARPLEPLNASPNSDKPVLKIEENSQGAKQPDEVVLKSGEKVEVDQKGDLGIIQQLTQNEFISLLQGDLFQGFTNQIPGIDSIRSVFEGLFPGVSFPISIPGIPTPSLPIPSLPSFPF